MACRAQLMLLALATSIALLLGVPAGAVAAVLHEASAGFTGQVVVGAEHGPAVPGFRLVGRGWQRNDLRAGEAAWTTPQRDGWNWVWTDEAARWHLVKRRLLRVDATRLAAAADGPTSTTTPLAGPWRSDGRFLRDRFERATFIHGKNAVWKHAPYAPPADRFGAHDARLLASHGFNGVRPGVMWAGVEPQPNRYESTYLARMRSIVDEAGTPVRFSFRHAADDRRFELVYDVDPLVSADTTIHVARHYEGGDTTYLKGPARVESADDAPLLVLRGTGVPGRVSVRVVRRGHRDE